MFHVANHPTTEGDDVLVGEFLAVRPFGDANHDFWLCRVIGITNETLRVHWFEQIDKKFFPLDEASKDAYGEVEKNMILVRGAHLVTGKNTLNKIAEKEIRAQLAAEKEDRMIST